MRWLVVPDWECFPLSIRIKFVAFSPLQAAKWICGCAVQWCEAVRCASYPKPTISLFPTMCRQQMSSPCTTTSTNPNNQRAFRFTTTLVFMWACQGCVSCDNDWQKILSPQDMCVFALRITFQMLQNAHPKPAAPVGGGGPWVGGGSRVRPFFCQKVDRKKDKFLPTTTT